MIAAGPLWLPPAPVAQAQAVSSPFGVNTHVGTRFGQFGRMHVPLDLVARHNVSWVREEFRWDVIQHRPGRWDWGFSDELVDTATARGLSILGLLVYSVGWANPGAGAGSNQPVWAMPANLDAYREYVSTVVSRYRGRVRAWEVWNEPNHAYFWQPEPKPEAYAALLRVASDAIRAADPGARVVLGGVSGSDIAFLERVVAAAGWDAFDVVAAHPYVAPKSPERGALADGEIAKLRAFVDRHGGNKPIWLTEFGWPTSTPGHWGVGDGDAQANYLVRGFVQATTSPGVERAFWYNWRNDGSDPGNDENNFGLVANDWRTPKPAATALRTLTRRLDNASFVRRLDLQVAGRTIVNDFEDEQGWHAWGDGATAQVERTSDERAGGSFGGRVRYAFTNGGKAYVDLQRIVGVPGEPQRLGVWVRGDSSGHLLWATFRDASDEYFRVFLCAIAGGWQQCEAPFDSFAHSDGDGVIQYPVRFQSLVLDNEPDGVSGEGTIVLDDLYVEDGPEVFGYRYDRAGRHVDVLWTVGAGAQLNLPTWSPDAVVTQRDGQSQVIAAQDGGLPLLVGEAPIYVEHVGHEPLPAPPPDSP
ncbi:MAG: endo-1,4-beta-xylanase [Chloroflexi bacterium]|nr:endo-1,4-beta-xylanase [Chloroflexota bacterium]